MVVGVVALIIAFSIEDEVTVSDAIDTHMHDRLVAHAHCHAALAMRAVAATLVMLCIPALLVGVLVVIRLAPGTLRRWMHQAFLRAVQLGLLVRLHSLLL